MLSFIRTKFQRVLDQAKHQGKNPVSYLSQRLFGKTWFYVFGLLDFLLIVINIPVYLLIIIFRLLLGYKKTNAIFFTGLEHVIKKSEDRAKLFERKGYRVFYHTTEVSAIPSLAHLSDVITFHTRLSFVNVYLFLGDVWKRKPCYVELYMEVKITQLLTEVLLCKLLGVPTVVIERGICLNIEIGNSDVFFRFWLQQLFRFADRIYYREPYLLEHMKRMGISESKVEFDHNKIPLSVPEPDFKQGNRTVLFLNSFIPARRVDLFAGAIPIVANARKDVTFLLVGFRSPQERKYAESLLEENGVRDLVEIYPYSENVRQYWDRASIFVFPADFVFANFALLEAMEKKLVPIVAEVRDAWRIVDTGVNGFLVPQQSAAFAEKIIALLDDEQMKHQMAEAARQKIKTVYNDADRVDSIDRFIRSRVGNELQRVPELKNL